MIAAYNQSLPNLPPLPQSPAASVSSSKYFNEPLAKQSSEPIYNQLSDQISDQFSVVSSDSSEVSSNDLQMVQIRLEEPSNEPSSEPTHHMRASLLKTISSFYRSSSPHHPELSSAAKLLRILHIPDGSAATPAVVTSETSATAATASHQQSLAGLEMETKKAIEDSPNASRSGAVANKASPSSAIPRRRKVSDLFTRLSSSSTAASRAKEVTESAKPSRIPKSRFSFPVRRFQSRTVSSPLPRPLSRVGANKDARPSSPPPPTIPSHMLSKGMRISHATAPTTGPTSVSLGPSTNVTPNRRSLSPLVPHPYDTPTAGFKPGPTYIPRPLTPMRVARGTIGNPISPSTPSNNVNRRQSEGPSPGYMSSARATSRMKHHRAGSSISSSSSLTQSTGALKVDELKSKISQLEIVMRQEKTDREAVYRLERTINMLESEVEKEKAEKLDLRSKLETLMYERDKRTSILSRLSTSTFGAAGNRDSSHSTHSTQSTQSMQSAMSMRSDGVSSCTTTTTADDDRVTMVGSPSVNIDDWRRVASEKLEMKIRILETELEKRREPKEELEYQNAITELKLGKQALLKENESLRAELRVQREAARVQRARLQNLEHKLTAKVSKYETSHTELNAATTRLENLSKMAASRLKMISIKERENEGLRTKNNVLEADLFESQTETHLANSQVLVLKRELEKVAGQAQQAAQRAQQQKKEVSQQIVSLERSDRRNARIITALEASLQDLKISLEEKAMENDELNRSIQKVMEQAHDSIEGAKRRSSNMLYSASPVLTLSQSQMNIVEE